MRDRILDDAALERMSWKCATIQPSMEKLQDGSMVSPLGIIIRDYSGQTKLLEAGYECHRSCIQYDVDPRWFGTLDVLSIQRAVVGIRIPIWIKALITAWWLWIMICWYTWSAYGA